MGKAPPAVTPGGWPLLVIAGPSESKEAAMHNCRQQIWICELGAELVIRPAKAPLVAE